MAQLDTRSSANPLDATMTRTQVVRRKFKSSLPRKIENRVLSKMEALGRTFELFDRLRNEMDAAGLDKNDSKAGLVYCQPETKGEEHILARTVALPNPGAITEFCDRVMALDKPRFLGLVFIQHDPDADKASQRDVAFLGPFMAGPEAEGRLIAARNQIAMGGFKAVAN